MIRSDFVKKFFYFSAFSFCAVLLSGGCMEWDYGKPAEFHAEGPGVFVVNEGNFQYGNASLSYYDPSTNTAEQEVFFRANGMRLGDQAQSMSMHNGVGWIAVCNSHVIFAIDAVSFKELGRVENAGQPRYIHFVSDSKAYVSQIWDNHILVVNPESFSISGAIEVPDMVAGTGSTEQMVSIGDYVYCNCWSYQNAILKIDTHTDSVVASLKVGRQPNSIVADAKGRLWALTDGLHYDASASSRARIVCIDPQRMAVIASFEFDDSSAPSELCIDADGSSLYWIDGHIWRASANPYHFAPSTVVDGEGSLFYGLDVSPFSGDIYVADAIDYQQPGIIRRYSKSGVLLDSFYAGVTPGAFCFKP